MSLRNPISQWLQVAPRRAHRRINKVKGRRVWKHFEEGGYQDLRERAIGAVLQGGLSRHESAAGLTSGFEWPARFDNVLAIGALTDAKDRSSFSNAGTIKTKYVMCPGGEWDDAANKATEWVGEGKNGITTTHCVGTSPATAYAVALLALYREHYISDLKAKGQVGELSAADLLDKAINNSVQDLTNYKSDDHGKGRFVYYP